MDKSMVKTSVKNQYRTFLHINTVYQTIILQTFLGETFFSGRLLKDSWTSAMGKQ